MNDTKTQLKILIERAVRPVRASTARKRKMREELLAHVSGVFEEELAKLGDDGAALEQTALRFGHAAEVTSQLQESVPASDGIWRFWEGRPDESTLRSALRFVWIELAISLILLGIAFFAAGWVSAWSRAELIAVVSSARFIPFWLIGPLWLFGIALLTHWMEKSLQGPEPLAGYPRIGGKQLFSSAWSVPAVRVALIVAGWCFFVLLCINGAKSPTQPFEWDQWTQIVAGALLTGFCAALAIVIAWYLVQSVAGRRRYHEEWASLPIDQPSGGSA